MNKLHKLLDQLSDAEAGIVDAREALNRTLNTEKALKKNLPSVICEDKCKLAKHYYNRLQLLILIAEMAATEAKQQAFDHNAMLDEITEERKGI